MGTYLFAWNPKHYHWDNISEMSEKVKRGEIISDRWSIGAVKEIKIGDRAFLIRLGVDPKGIIASGSVISDPFEDVHWDVNKAKAGEKTYYVNIKYDVLLNPDTDRILSRENLMKPPLQSMHWDTQMSGIRIPEDISRQLEVLWSNTIREGQGMGIKEDMLFILENYQEAKSNSIVKEKVKSSFDNLRSNLQNIPVVKQYKNINVNYSMGIGMMANVPWISLLDLRETDSTQHGVYCVFLFKADLSGVYITFNQGVGRTASQAPTKENIEKVQTLAATIRTECAWLSDYGFHVDEKINLADQGSTGRAYEKSTIAYKYYSRESIPSDINIASDLGYVLKAYDDYVNTKGVQMPHKLAEPFSRLFKDWDEAMWALDIFHETLDKVGITDPDDERFAITLPYGHTPKIRIILGNWVLIGFRARSRGASPSMDIALLDETSKSLAYSSHEPFVQFGDDPKCQLFIRIPLSDFRDPNSDLRHAYAISMPQIGDIFIRWNRSRIRGLHVMAIAEAVFDPSKREALLANGIPNQIVTAEYTLEKCAEKTGFPLQELQRWLRAIERKKQAILYGPPGTGKTYLAQALANVLISGGDGFIEIVQFHPAYAYEDFMQGIRPNTRPDGTLEYPLLAGRFLSFCDRASTCSGACVLIIDEINRANLSRVFGELMYLLEYREESIDLAGGTSFQIPANVRIIGTMNTADRSIALVDHALRRRFAFMELRPNMDILRKYQNERHVQVNGLINVLEDLNRVIDNPHYSVGISYFLCDDLMAQMEDIWKMEIEPYLGEYFFDQPERAHQFAWENIKTRILV